MPPWAAVRLRAAGRRHAQVRRTLLRVDQAVTRRSKASYAAARKTSRSPVRMCSWSQTHSRLVRACHAPIDKVGRGRPLDIESRAPLVTLLVAPRRPCWSNHPLAPLRRVMCGRVTVGLVAGHADSVGWTVEIEGIDPAREPTRSALLTLGDGVIGTTAVSPGHNEAGGVVAAGIYHGTGPETALAPLPSWNYAPLAEAVTFRRVLDLRDGTLRSELDTPAGEASTLSFASLARPGTAVLIAESPSFADRSAGPLSLPVGAEHGRESARWWAGVHGSGGAVVAASERVVRVAGARLRLERLVAYATDTRQAPRPEAALEALEAAERLGVDTLLAEQRTAWARRWSAADIRIEGDPELQRAVRFCLFQLMASVSIARRPRSARRG